MTEVAETVWSTNLETFSFYPEKVSSVLVLEDVESKSGKEDCKG